MTSTLHVPDLSEWQTGARVDKLPALIIRAHNGHRPDHAHATFRTQSKRAVVRGHYGYIVANRDAATQGREFAAVVGRLAPGEFAVGDLEEGAGDQSRRFEEWAREVDAALGGNAWEYSGRSFMDNQLAGVSGHRARWVAAYGQSTPPRGPHLLWQHTDREAYRLGGLRSTRVDCSVFVGTLTQLREAVDASQHRPVYRMNPPAPWHATPRPPAQRTPAPVLTDLPAGAVLKPARPGSPASTGAYVHAVQVRLAARGWRDVPQTGTYDERTAVLVELFQRDVNAHGWPALQVDGKVGPATWRALFHAPVTR